MADGTWILWIRWGRLVLGVVISLAFVVMSCIGFLEPNTGGGQASQPIFLVWLQAARDWCLNYSCWIIAAVVVSVIVQGLLFAVLYLALQRRERRGLSCPAVNSVLASFYRFIASQYPKPSSDMAVILYKALDVELFAFAGCPTIPKDARVFPIDPSSPEKNLGVAGRCWYLNRAKGGGHREQVRSRGILPDLQEDSSADQIREYCEKTFDLPERVANLETLPRARYQYAYPIFLPGKTHEGVCSPWGVLMVYSSKHVQMPQFVRLRLTDGGFLVVLEELIAKHALGNLLLCSSPLGGTSSKA